MKISRRGLGQGVAAAAGGLALTGIGAGPVMAQRSANTLRVAFRDAVPNIDPYFNSQRTGIIIAHQAMDGLVHRDPDTFRNVPALATEWAWQGNTAIDFKIRPGVKFHDGSDFGPDDVVYTMNGIAELGGRLSTPGNYSWIEGAEKLDANTVRIKMKRPNPAALDYLAMVTPIWPKVYRERVGPEGFSRMPISTGPYRFTKVDVSNGVEYERFDGYYQGGPKGRPAIQRITARYLSDAATELTELLAQRVDWIWNMNPDNIANVNRLPFLQALQQETMRVGYLGMDAAGRTGAGNPMTHLKVRQAIFHAIDRQSLADKLVTGGSRVPPAPCYPSQFGCNGDVAVQYEYNPAKARQLLAEAGFANGFDVELTSYVQPRQWSEAVQNYLQAVGIRARLNLMQVAAQIQRSQRGELTLAMGSWGSFSINDVSAFLPQWFAGGNEDYARDQQVIDLVNEGGSSADEAVRKRAYDAAIKRIMEMAYFVPLHTYVSTYAYQRQLEFKAYADELPRFYLSKWK